LQGEGGVRVLETEGRWMMSRELFVEVCFATPPEQSSGV